MCKARASNSSCSEAMILPICNWLFYLGGWIYSAILCVEISPIYSNE